MTNWRVPQHLRYDPGDVIPANWSLEEVNLVFDFLLRVTAAIYHNYEDQMNPNLRTKATTAGTESEDEPASDLKERLEQPSNNSKKGTQA